MVDKLPLRQEIDLYLPELRPKQDWLAPKNSLLFVAVCVVLLMLITAGKLVTLLQANSQYEEKQAQIVQMQSAVEQLRRQIPQSQAAVMKNEIDALKTDINRQEKIRDVISRQDLGSTNGFSSQLKSLSRQISADVSLQKLVIMDSGARVYLAGQARTADAVPLYVQRLQQEHPFVGSSFGGLSIENADRFFNFRLGNISEAAP